MMAMSLSCLLGRDCFFWITAKPGHTSRPAFFRGSGNTGAASRIACLRSLALAIEGLRQLERHGGSLMLERAFTGFLAIAPPAWKKPWREVFGIKPNWTGNITELYRAKARTRHPDAGGSDTLMAELNIAYEEARRELGQ